MEQKVNVFESEQMFVSQFMATVRQTICGRGRSTKIRGQQVECNPLSRLRIIKEEDLYRIYFGERLFSSPIYYSASPEELDTP